MMTQDIQFEILRLPAVKKMTGLPTSTLYNLLKNNQFPKNIKLGPRSVGWLKADIEHWIACKIAELTSKKGRD